MSKKSKRPSRAARDVHEAIRAAAAELSAAASFGFRKPEEFPEVAALIRAGREAVAASVPKSFVFAGRTYYLRCCMAVQLDIFGAPGDFAPLVQGLSMSTDDAGHVPGH